MKLKLGLTAVYESSTDAGQPKVLLYIDDCYWWQDAMSIAELL